MLGLSRTEIADTVSRDQSHARGFRVRQNRTWEAHVGLEQDGVSFKGFRVHQNRTWEAHVRFE